MTRRSRQRARRGSVLMEFVVVAPLYLLLLGGMFAAGELSLNRVRMAICDRYVTWLGGSRFCPSVTRADGRTVRDGDWVGRSLNPVFQRALDGAAAVAFRVNTPEDTGVDVNGFMSLYMGGVTNMTVTLPDWVVGLMSVQPAAAGTADGASSYDKTSYDVNYFRTYLFQRTDAAGRLAPGSVIGDAASSGAVFAAASDGWISDEASDAGVPSGGGASGGGAVRRMLGRFAE